MKHEQLVFLGLSIIFLGVFSFGTIQVKANLSNPLILTVNSAKQSYMLGEPAELSFTLTNSSNKDTLVGCFGLSNGDFQILTSQNNKDFLEYTGDWAVIDATCSGILKPDNKIEIPFTKILWNSKIEDSNIIASGVIERARKGKIVSYYAFPEAGIYFIKAKSLDLKIESEPIQITIKKPVGEDLEAWNKIKDNGDFAYFLQEGEFRIPSYKNEERAKFQSEVEDIINQYPNSFYAQSLRQSLDKFKSNEAKRQELRQKLQNQKENPQ